MRRFLARSISITSTIIALACAPAVAAQRTPAAPDSTTRAAIDEFTVTVRDMAAWAITTPAAHIPVGGMLDNSGNVSSVTSDFRRTGDVPDSVLTTFRQALGLGARQRKSVAIGMAYLVRRIPAGGTAPVEAVLVEVEHRSGYRVNVLYPYAREESGEPVFASAVRLPGTLRSMATRSRGGRVVADAEANPPSSSAPTVAAPAAAPDTTRPSLEVFARRIVRAVPYPTFITNDASGRPQARTVQPQQPDSAWTVWFATNPRTRKVTEVQRDPRVVLHYFDQSTLSYVSLVGRARVVRDRATKSAHWASAWDAFYPDRDTSVVLIAVDAERLEIVSSTLGISGDAATWRPPTVQLPRRVKPKR
jgi:general stress protein 26